MTRVALADKDFHIIARGVLPLPITFDYPHRPNCQMATHRPRRLPDGTWSPSPGCDQRCGPLRKAHQVLVGDGTVLYLLATTATLAPGDSLTVSHKLDGREIITSWTRRRP